MKNFELKHLNKILKAEIINKSSLTTNTINFVGDDDQKVDLVYGDKDNVYYITLQVMKQSESKGE